MHCDIPTFFHVLVGCPFKEKTISPHSTDHSERAETFTIMSRVGPELPPHLAAKRKHEDDNEEERPARAHPASRSRSPSDDGAEKRPRILGPSLPPANLDERPSTAPSGVDDSDSDDEIGPALPPPPGHYDPDAKALRSKAVAEEELARQAASKPKREEWMLVPPKQDDWSSRIDPTKLKNRKFNTGKGAKGPAQKGGGDNTLWTETPEEKLKRLEDEVMGVKRPAHLDQDSHKSARSQAEARETERRIREYNVSSAQQITNQIVTKPPIGEESKFITLRPAPEDGA